MWRCPNFSQGQNIRKLVQDGTACRAIINGFTPAPTPGISIKNIYVLETDSTPPKTHEATLKL